MKKILYTLVLFLPFFLWSQKLPVQLFTTENGLPSNYSVPLLHDHFGFLWTGSSEGLSAYDGNQFTNFGKNEGFSGDAWMMVEDKNQLWIAGRYGLHLATRSDLFPLHLKFKEILRNDSKKGQETNLFKTSSGYVISSDGVDIFVCRNQTATKIKFQIVNQPDISTINIQSIQEDKKGRIYFIGYRTVYISVSPFDPDSVLKLENYFPEKTSIPANIETAFVDGEGTVWFLTLDQNLYCISNQKKVGIFPLKKFNISKVGSLFRESSNTFWVTCDHKLLRFQTKLTGNNPDLFNLQFFEKETGIPADAGISGLLSDRHQNLWITALPTGLVRIKKDGFINFQNKNEKTLSPVLMAQINDSLFLTVNPDVHLYQAFYNSSPYLNIQLKENIKLKFNPVHATSLFEYSADTLLLINNKDGLYCSGKGKFNFSKIAFTGRLKNKTSQLFSENDFLFMKKDSKNRAWISLNHVGLIRGKLKQNSFEADTVFTLENGLHDNSIRAFLEDRNGKIWLGGFNQGLSVLEKDHFTNYYTVGNGLTDNSIRSLIETSDGTILIGTRYGGLSQFKNKSLSAFEFQNELKTNTIWTMITEDKSLIWLGTEQGLKSIFYSDSDTIPFIQSYSSRIGIPQEPIYSLYLDRSQNIFCSTANGFYIGNTKLLSEPRSFLPEIYFTDFEINGKSVVDSLIGQVDYDYDNSISIHYETVDPGNEATNSFIYRIEGSNTAWSSESQNHHLLITKLNPGKYSFHVRSVTKFSSNKSPKTFPEISLSFKISTPYWMSWWFISICLVLLIVLFASIYFYRVGQLLKFERLRSKLAGDLHDDIGANLTRINIFSNLVVSELSKSGQQENVAKAKNLSEEIGSASRNVIDSMNDIVWTINPAKDTFDDLLLRMKNDASRLLEAKNIEYKFDSEISDLTKRMNPEWRKNVYLIYKEALHNIIKHSKCKVVSVSVIFDGHHFSLSISDNGTGFELDMQSSGNGLSSMKNRARLIKGKLHIVSATGEGTQIQLESNT